MKPNIITSAEYAEILKRNAQRENIRADLANTPEERRKHQKRAKEFEWMRERLTNDIIAATTEDCTFDYKRTT